MQRVLGGVGVVELAEGVAGSYCGKLFADLGADVVKVEARVEIPSGPRPEGSRSSAGGAFPPPEHQQAQRRDRSGRAGRRPNGCGGSSNVPTSSSRYPGPATWPATASAGPPCTSGCRRWSWSASAGFGATGPYAGYKWSDLTVQAMSGALLLQHSDQQDPVKLPARVALYFVGSMAARRRAGRGAVGPVRRRRALRRLRRGRGPGLGPGPGHDPPRPSIPRRRRRTQFHELVR